MKTLLSAIFTFLSNMNPVVASLFAAVTTAYSAFSWLNSQMSLLISQMDTLAQANFSGTLNVSPFGLCNTFIPLQEAMTLFAAWVSVLVICATIRIVKAWVPTVSS